MNLLLRLSFVALGLVLGARVFAAETAGPTEYGEFAGSVLVPEGLRPAEVQQALLLAATGRGWSLKDRADGRVVIFLEQRGWRSTLTLVYGTTDVKIYSDSGKTDKAGQIKKQEVPASWVKFLRQDIAKHLGMKSAAK